MSDSPPKDPVAHRKLAVIETADADALNGLFADAEIRPHLWLRVSDCRALVDPLALAAVAKRLAALDLPPRFQTDLSE